MNIPQLATPAMRGLAPMIPDFLLRPFKLLMLLLLVTSTSQAADVNVLVIGCEKDFRSYKAYSGAAVVTEFRKILEGAGLGTVNVMYEDRKFQYDTTGSTMQTDLYEWFYGPYPADVERTTRWPNLRGQAGTAWDYVVLIGDGYTIERFPGFYAAGVASVAGEVAKGTAKPILLMTWPYADSYVDYTGTYPTSVAHYEEVTYRVGNSGGYKVAPAGLAWQAAGSPKTADQHPNSDSAYIAAATLFSTIWNKSATNSTYNPKPNLAQTAHTAFTNSLVTEHYTGKYNMTSANVQGFYDIHPREIVCDGIDSSSENAVKSGFRAAMLLSGGDQSPIVASSRIVVNTQRSVYYGGGTRRVFAMESQTVDTLSGGQDEYCSTISSDISRIFNAQWNNNPNRNNTDVSRWLPFRMIYARIAQRYPASRPFVSNHKALYLSNAMGSFGVTQLGGRTPMMPPEQVKSEDDYCFQAGYELAWQFRHLQVRAPGFRFIPDSQTVGLTTPEVIRVKFYNKPKSNVTVTVTSAGPVTIENATLTFTPENYNVEQQVRVLATAAAVRGSTFEVGCTTSSSDDVYDGIHDAWPYMVNRLPTSQNIAIDTFAGHLTPITLKGQDPDGEPLTYEIVNPPQHGTVTIFRALAVYTANKDYTGSDSFTYKCTDSGDYSNVSTVSINVAPHPLYNLNLIKNGDALLAPLNEFYWTTQSGAWTEYKGQFIYNAVGVLYQDVDVSDYAFDIDGRRQFFTFNGNWRTADQYPLFDDFRFVLEYRGASNQVLQTLDSGVLAGSASWVLYERNFMPPVGTRTIRVIMKANTYGKKRYYADNLKLIAKTYLNEVPIADHQSGVVASAGVSNTITLTASDGDADALTYIIVNQPQHGTVTVNGTGPTVNYLPNANYLGSDSFSFKVNDLRDDSNVAIVNTMVVANQAPTVTITSPTQDTAAFPQNVGLLLKATVVDDAKPAPAMITWSKVSGPGTVTFESPNSANTAVEFNSVYGTYVLRLTVNDGQYSASDTVTVYAGNYDTTIDRGPYVLVNHYVGAPGVPIVMNAVNIIDDGLPNPPGAVQIFWRQISGPGGALFSSNDIQNPTVTFPVVGNYVLRVSAFDGATETFHDVYATISSGNLPPVALSQTVEVNKNSTNNSITLSSTDTENDPVTYAIVRQPFNGTVTLIGSGPQVTYTPTTDFGGNDSFTFKANDGKDSNVATVTVKVKTAPVVNAGVDRVVYQNVPVPWTPAAMTTAAWYAADDAGTISQTSGAVTQWREKKNNGRNLAQATSTAQPRTGTRTINGLNAIEFDGSNDVLLGASNRTAAITIFGVVQVDSGTGTDANRSWMSAPGGENPDFWMPAPANADTLNAYLLDTTGSGSSGSRLAVRNAAHIQAAYSWIPSGAAGGLRLDGGTTASLAAKATGMQQKATELAVGRQKNTGNRFHDGLIGEIIIINSRLTEADPDFLKIEGYLAHKWGLVDKLPADHPYKSAAPLAGMAALVELNGSATDANGDTLTTAWTVTEGVATVATPSSLVTSSSIMTSGFYTFRLTANDGTFQPYDDVRIEVRALDPNNAAPVAQAQSIRVARNSVNNAIALTATDAENNALTYAIKTYPVNGTLSGTPPNLTYTPNTSFSGSDSFTFTASDFQQPSQPATVNITINSLPTVDAGPNQTVVLQTVPWTPVQMTITPSLWYDADDASTISQTSGAVSQWNDKSPNAKHLAQSTAGAQPKTNTRTINGRNAIEFDGSDDVLLGAANKTDAITIFGVVQVDSGSGTDANRSWMSAPGGNNPDFWMPAPTNADTLGAYLLDTTGSGSSGSRTAVRNSAHVIGAYSWVPNGAAGGLRLDGGTTASLAAKATGMQQKATELAIGRQKSTSGRFHDGLIGEIIIINSRLAETDDDFLRIEGYLAHKWGLTAKLPEGHPYKSAKPVYVTATLDATAYDADADPISTNWSLASTAPAGLPSVKFANASAVDTTAIFTQLGQYTLRLTATQTGEQNVSDEVTITVTNGTSTPPTLASLSPVSGTTAGGTAVTITGTNLTSASSVTFGGTAATSVTVVNSTTVTCVTPAKAAGTVDVVITTPGGSATMSAGFTYIAPVVSVTFNANGGTTPSPTGKSVTSGSPYGTLATTSRTGYSFKGWFTAASAGSLVTSATIVSAIENHTLHAQWYASPVVNAGPDQTVALSGGNSTLWTPALLTTKAAWYDAADASTITASGGLVSQWNDKSGNANHLTGSGGPKTGTRTINGVNVIDFDGTDDQLMDTTFSSLSIANVSIFMVQKYDRNDVQSMTAFTLERTTDTEGMMFHSTYDTTFSFGQRYPNNVSTNYPENTNVELLSYVKSGTSSQKGWGNGQALATQSGTVTTFTAQRLALGSRSDSNYLDGAIGEFIIVPAALSDTDRQKLEGYLAHKWGTSASLPADHPYKSSAPTEGSTPTATATLAGSASDADNDSLTTTWSVLSTPDRANVTFADASAPSTTATFTAAGDYVLRLTASDGTYAHDDDVTITVTDSTSGLDAFTEWAAIGGGGGEVTFIDDSNGDGIADGMAWLLGANQPTHAATDLLPQAEENNGSLTLTFKMLNSSKRGTAVLRLEHSSDLGVTSLWAENAITIPDASSTVEGVAFTITPIGETDHNQVVATLPASGSNGSGKLFVRLNGVLAP